MDYKKKYKEALERCREFYAKFSNKQIKEEIEEIFPELAESEDEKIRKHLIKHFSAKSKEKWNGISVKDILAWLEKQGESAEINPSEFDLRLNKLLKRFEPLPKEELARILNVIQNDGIYKEEKQGEQKPYASETMNEKGDFDNGFTRMMEKEQKPTWSEENEKMLKDTIRFCELCGNKVSANWLKSIKDRVQPKPQSDERNRLLGKLEEWLDEYVSNLADVDTATLICSFSNYLDGKLPKSLRPQSQWKPSEEQMVQLHKYCPDNIPLTSLYEQLKKLREE